MWGFPGGSAVKNLPAIQEPQEMQVRSLGQEDSLQQSMTIHSSVLAWRIRWINKVCYSVVKNPPANAGDAENGGLIPGSGRSPGGRNGNPLQCSCLENPMDREAWWATVHRFAVRYN